MMRTESQRSVDLQRISVAAMDGGRGHTDVTPAAVMAIATAAAEEALQIAMERLGHTAVATIDLARPREEPHPGDARR